MKIPFWRAAAIVLLVIAVCSDGNAAQNLDLPLSEPTYSLSYSKSGTGNGTVISSNGKNYAATDSEAVAQGAVVTLTPVPSADSLFFGWSGCDSVDGNVCTVAMSSDRSITGTFTIQSFSITANVTSGSGTITPVLSTVDYGGSLAFTIAPESNQFVSSFQDNGVVATLAPGSGNTYGYTLSNVTADHALTVSFTALTDVTAITTSSSHTVALKSDGTVWAWGYNYYGQLGDGTTTNRINPVQVSGISGVAAVAASDSHTVALKSDGTVWAWGSNGSGQLGDGTTTNRSMPVQVLEFSGMTAVAAGGGYTVGLRNDGTVWALGYNYFGQLGDGTKTNRAIPVQATGVSGVTAIAAGAYYSTVALKGDGTVWAWGSNNYGQLGDGSTTNRSIPVQVPISGVTAVAPGYMVTHVLKGDGTVWGWGGNQSGQLGNGTTGYSELTPVQVVGVAGATAITSGNSHALALISDGTIWAWGGNSIGQIGDGSIFNRLTPVQVKELSGVVAVSAGGNRSLAKKGDGTLWAWGDNDYGQLGDGTTTKRLTRTLVQGIGAVMSPLATINGAPASYINSTGATLTVGGADVVSYKYKLDGGSYSGEIPVATPLTLSSLAEGTHVVAVIGRDNIGNWQPTPTTTSWTVDVTPPATSPSSMGGAYKTSLNVELTCDDGGGSGCGVNTYYCLGTGCTPAIPYRKGGIAIPTSTMMRFYSQDVAGNFEAVKTATYTIDSVPPTTTPTPAAGSYPAARSVTLSCNDTGGSGCAGTWYCLGAGCTPTNVYSGAIAVTTSTDLRFFSKDTAGNIQTIQTASYTVATTIRVPADQPTIQKAINVAGNGDKVSVAPGTYLENINFQGKAITVQSTAGPDATIIDGQQAGSVVIFASGETNLSVLEGFTIRNGKPSGSISPYNGGGIYITNASPVISNNNIVNNTGCQGVGIYAYRSSTIIHGNLISNNVRSGCTGGGGGGISLVGDGSAQILDNEISSNSVALSGDGGGIHLNGAGTPLIRGNIIRGNTAAGISPCAYGGGIEMVNTNDAIIVQNIISDNSAGCGGGVSWMIPFGARGPYLINNTIVGNDAATGSGLYADGYDASVLLTNNIIVGKSGQTAVYCGNFNDIIPPIFRNNIIYAQSGSVYGGYFSDQNGANGNKTTDPLLYEFTTGKYYPRSGSPAIDAGDNGAPSLIATDMGGNSRIMDGNSDGVATIDIGAFELDPNQPTATISGAPANPTNSTNAILTVGGTDVMSYKYKLDAGSYSSEIVVATPISLTGLSEATHTVTVLGRNGTGSWQMIPTVVGWAVDLTPPTAIVSGTPSSPTNSTSASLTVNGIGVVSYKFKLDYGSYSAETAIATPISLTSLSEATHVVSVIGKDSAGNWQVTPSTVTWTVDLPPVTTLITNPAAADGANGWFVTTPTITLASSKPGTTYYLWGLTSSGYSYSTQTQSWLTGGTALNFRGDDVGGWYTLPFGFSFYGTIYTSVYVSSNGLMRFDTSDTYYSNSGASLESKVAIAPLWDDLYTSSRVGDDIYVFQPDPDSICFRWQSTTLINYYDTNFEAILYRDGRIKFNYGAQSGGLNPTIGISKGDGATYHIPYDSNLSSSNNMASILYTPNGWNTYTVALTPASGDNILKYYSVDTLGTTEAAKNQHIKVDTWTPVSFTSVAEGSYNASKSVSLSCSDSGGSGCAGTWYCLGTGCTSATLYSTAVTIASSTALRFYSEDIAGNTEAVKTVMYTIDTIPPTTAANPVGGTYSTAQTVTLACNDNGGSGCSTTYYCLGIGCTPTTLYSSAITIANSTDLRFYSKDAAGNSEGVQTATYTILAADYAVNVTIGGTGSGIVTSSPAGLACNTGCSARFPGGDTVTLHAVPLQYSIFDGWSGACTGTGDCVITMTGDRTSGAAFKKDSARGTSSDTGAYHASIQAAYAAAAHGHAIRLWGTDFTEELFFAEDKGVWLRGGFDEHYLSQEGVTTVHGSIAISAGTVTVEGVEIVP